MVTSLITEKDITDTTVTKVETAMADVRITVTVKVANVRTALLIIRVSIATTVRNVRNAVMATVSREHVRTATVRLMETEKEEMNALVITTIIREAVRNVLPTVHVTTRRKTANSVSIVRGSITDSKAKAVTASSVRALITVVKKEGMAVSRMVIIVHVQPTTIRMRSTA